MEFLRFSSFHSNLYYSYFYLYFSSYIELHKFVIFAIPTDYNFLQPIARSSSRINWLELCKRLAAKC